MKRGAKKGGSKVIANVRVGKRQVRPDLPSHVAGVHQGNATALLKRTRNTDLKLEGDRAIAKATRSTGINAKQRLPIDPRMPKLTPP